MIVAALMLLGGHLVLTYTRFGRYVYMVGGNREAAEYSGLNVNLILGSVMVISAVCSGIGGMLGVAHFGSAQQNEFDTYLLDSIAAVVVGGTSLFGGRGGIGNTIVGLFVLGVLNNGLDHVNIDSFLKILIRGLILLAALVINVYAQRLRDQGGRIARFPHPRNPAANRAALAPLSSRRRSSRKRRRVQHHRAGETQASRLAGRPQSHGSSIHFEIDIVRETEDAADDLCRGKSDGVLEQPIHVGLPFGLEAGLRRPARRKALRDRRRHWPRPARARGTCRRKLRPYVFDRLQHPCFERRSALRASARGRRRPDSS